MLFHTPTFLVFLCVVVLAFGAARARRARKLVLVLASCVFYMWWSPIFILLMVGPMIVDYNVALALEVSPDPRRRRLLLGLSILDNLGLLAYFKYFAFLAKNALLLLRGTGLGVDWQTPSIALPIGISFFTFERISYTVDVYRRRTPATRSPIDFALFISFFPRLVAGPIVRASEFLPQLRSDLPLRFDAGIFFLVLRGLMKKVVVADNLSGVVAQVFADPAAWPSIVIWLGAVSFAVQIYCDFSGYSDMAVGLGRIFGLELPQNFAHPYFARNPSDFWRRWHITLSSWLRDYLYVPLGGNRGGVVETYRNLMLTMLLGGLWHGASWNFVLWGFLHGLALCVYRAAHDLGLIAKPTAGRSIGRVLSWAAMQYWVLLCWIAFRVQDTGHMLTAMRKFLFFDGVTSLANIGIGNLSVFSTILILGGFALLHALSAWVGDLDRRLAEASLPVAFAVSTVAGLVFVALWPLAEAPFIYFQF